MGLIQRNTRNRTPNYLHNLVTLHHCTYLPKGAGVLTKLVDQASIKEDSKRCRSECLMGPDRMPTRLLPATVPFSSPQASMSCRRSLLPPAQWSPSP
jgi:hypothetical protein